MKQVSLDRCEYIKGQKQLRLASEYFGMPERFEVVSHLTNRIVEFMTVPRGHPLYDEDGWDGEMCVYQPVDHLKNVESLVIYHAY